MNVLQRFCRGYWYLRWVVLLLVGKVMITPHSNRSNYAIDNETLTHFVPNPLFWKIVLLQTEEAIKLGIHFCDR
jgi:hypothetical protein